MHGEARARLAREFSSSELPRAALAVNLSEVAPIEIRSATLVADNDPYNSLKPTLKPEPVPQAPTQTADSQKTEDTGVASEVKTANNAPQRSGAGTQSPQSNSEIRKAIPVEPIRKAIPVAPQQTTEVRRAIPVKPLDQEDENATLLRSATPPRDLDE